MAVVTTDIRFYNIAEFSWSGINPFYDSDKPAFDTGGTFTFSAVAAPQIVTITDLTGEDGALTDKDFGDQYIDFADPSRVVVAEGGSYGNGTQLETAWRYNVSGSDGSAFQVWGVTFNQNDNSVEGIVAGQPFVPSVTYTLLGDPPPSTTGGAPFSVIACLVAGTMIRTRGGLVPVERLEPGDPVWTIDNGFQPIRWVGRWQVAPAAMQAQPGLRPVRIEAGALGAGVPHRTTLVSAQHRLLVRSAIAQRMFGRAEVLVAARYLSGLPGVRAVVPDQPVTYAHLLLDRHQIVAANGALTETLLTGQQGLAALPPWTLMTLSARLPRLVSQPPVPARPIVTGARARKLLTRHRKNGKPVQGAARPPWPDIEKGAEAETSAP